MRIFALLLTLPVLAACDTIPKVEKVEVPIPVPCKITIPNPPPECRPLNDTRAEWLRCMLSDCELRRGYQAELEAALKACVSN